jgi:hypothetical protein
LVDNLRSNTASIVGTGRPATLARHAAGSVYGVSKLYSRLPVIHWQNLDEDWCKKACGRASPDARVRAVGCTAHTAVGCSLRASTSCVARSDHSRRGAICSSDQPTDSSSEALNNSSAIPYDFDVQFGDAQLAFVNAVRAEFSLPGVSNAGHHDMQEIDRLMFRQFEDQSRQSDERAPGRSDSDD